MKIKILVIIALLSLGLTYALLQEEELIKGTWLPKGCSTCQWVFADGKCYQYYEGRLEDTYNYEILEEKSLNGKLTFAILILTNVSDPNDVYEYEINALGEEKMALEYLGGTRSGLLFYTKKAIAPN